MRISDWSSDVCSSDLNMPDETFASSGHATVARRLYDMAGVGAGNIDVALIYDHFTSQVIMQIEDYGFCAKGEGGPFVASGATRIELGRASCRERVCQ